MDYNTITLSGHLDWETTGASGRIIVARPGAEEISVEVVEKGLSKIRMQNAGPTLVRSRPDHGTFL